MQSLLLHQVSWPDLQLFSNLSEPWHISHSGKLSPPCGNYYVRSDPLSIGSDIIVSVGSSGLKLGS